MLERAKYYTSLVGNGILQSYAQVFFSNNKLFALILLFISFFDVGAGLAGIIAILISQVTAILFNFSHTSIRDGMYTYNSLMVGIAIGIFYDFNFSLFILLTISSLLTFLATVWFSQSLGAKKLPFLSIPFLLVIWIVILGAGNFSALSLDEKDKITLALYWPELFTGVTQFIRDYVPFYNATFLYLRSLGAIFFQYNDLAGLLIAIGLLCYSRISFILSLFGFALGYFFYRYMEGDFSQLIYSYIGFNFILTSIALGGFFVVASRRSFLLLVFTIPLIAILLSALHTLFSYFQLPLYSLPFNLVVLLFLYTMLNRQYTTGLNLVTIQHFSPEKNHYRHYNRVERFKSETLFHISLPVIGKWFISQGHKGNITHKDDWQYAWDFDIRDDYGKTFKEPGYDLKDYYCYDLPVIAPAAGYVVNAIDGIDDNLVGEMDVQNNWGNTVIIKHGDYLFSKLSHLRKNTLQVKVGDYVQKGDIIGYCGSSGRSPEPHLHFQLQATPYVGAKTLQHPISYYMTEKGDHFEFHSFDIPDEGDVVSDVNTTKLLTESFSFIPGKTLEWQVDGKTVRWEVFSNPMNQLYIYCHTTGATAYFVNNGTLFYFTEFYGKKSSLLYQFYLGAQRVLLGYYPGVKLHDLLQPEDTFSSLLKSVHDITAPFFHYLKGEYESLVLSVDHDTHPKEMVIKSICTGKVWGKKTKEKAFELTLRNNRIESFRFSKNDKTTEAVCIVS